MATYSNELSRELPRASLAARMVTSRHVARTHSMKAVNACFLFCSILGGLVGLAYLLLDPIIKHVVLTKLVLRDNSDFADLWSTPPVTPHIKVYFFNLTNAEKFFNGEEKPILDEVGPYVYHQKWFKENITFHPNGTMSYSSRKEFTFMLDLSVGDQRTDRITTVNVPLASAYYQKRSSEHLQGLETIGLVEEFIEGFDYNLWVSKTPEELIWGYDEPLLQLADNPDAFGKTSDEDCDEWDPFSKCDHFAEDDSFKAASTKFGYFSTKNASSNLPLYTMYTGEGNPYNLSKISLFNGSEYLDYWKTDTCNKVMGSDGATFNPYIQKEETLYFFNDALCRAMPLVFDKKVTASTLPGYRFVPRSDVFMSPKSVPENDCYCVDETLCGMIGDGMFGVSKCQMEAPIVLSWPHFLRGEQRFQDAVVGLRPDEERHGFWFDIQQTTGTTLAAAARLQINIALKRMPHYRAMSKIREDTVLPTLWFEEGVDELGAELVDVIREAVDAPPLYKNYLLCILVGIIFALIVIGSVALIRVCADHRSRHRREETIREVASKLLDMPHMPGQGGQHGHGQQGGGVGPTHLSAYAEEALQPMLGSSGFASGATTEEGSRATTATHSRNASDGSGIVNGGGSSTVPRVAAEEREWLIHSTRAARHSAPPV